MKRAILTLIALIACLASANAKIGETYAQVYTEAQHDKDTIALRPGNESGKVVLLAFYRNGDTIKHVFGSNGREIAFYWWTRHNITSAEVGKVQRVFRTKWRAIRADAGWTTWQNTGSLELWLKENFLSILDLRWEKEIFAHYPRAIAVAPGYPRLVTPTPAPVIDFQPLNPNDCLIVATQALTRLKPTSHWARIARFSVTEYGKAKGGHAVVFFQPTASSNVYMYDANGSLNMHTKSHELDVLIAVANNINAASNEPARFTRSGWVDGDGSAKDDQIDLGTANRNYENWQKNQGQVKLGAKKPSGKDDAVAIAGVIMIVAFGVFARYGGVRIWPIAILSEPVYLMIESIRTKWSQK